MALELSELLSAPFDVVAIPVEPLAAEVALDIQFLIDKTYDRGRYDDIDYTRDPDPPLEGEDACWADALLRARGKRK